MLKLLPAHKDAGILGPTGLSASAEAFGERVTPFYVTGLLPGSSPLGQGEGELQAIGPLTWLCLRGHCGKCLGSHSEQQEPVFLPLQHFWLGLSPPVWAIVEAGLEGPT